MTVQTQLVDVRSEWSTVANGNTQLKQADEVFSEFWASSERLIKAFEGQMREFLFAPIQKVYTECDKALDEVIAMDLADAWVLLPQQKQSGQFTLRQLHRALEQADPKLLESVGPTGGFLIALDCKQFLHSLVVKQSMPHRCLRY